MRQVLHLLIVDAATRTALTANVSSRWLLPILACGERARADPLAARWARDRGLECDVVGQWLGRVSSGRIDWLMVLSVVRMPASCHPLFTWTALDTLRSAAAVDDYQKRAVAASLLRAALPEVAGPFGRFGWMEGVRHWIARHGESRVSALDGLRSSPHEVVRRACTGRGDLYFKGMSGERAWEARLTIELAARAPDHFARTIALEDRPDGGVWWLTEGCPGRPPENDAALASTLAALQQRAAGVCSVARQLRPLDLDAPLDWASGMAADPSAAAVLHGAVQRIARSPPPVTWVPLDLHPTNVLVDDGGNVRFIDLDDSFLGPAPLAMAAVVNRCGDRSLYETYERSWAPALRGIDWRAFERTAAVIQLWLGWRRLLRKTGRGEIAGAVGPAAIRVRERLRRMFRLKPGQSGPNPGRLPGPAEAGRCGWRSTGMDGSVGFWSG